MNVFVLHNILKGGCNNNNNNDSDCNSKCIREKKKNNKQVFWWNQDTWLHTLKKRYLWLIEKFVLSLLLLRFFKKKIVDCPSFVWIVKNTYFDYPSFSPTKLGRKLLTDHHLCEFCTKYTLTIPHFLQQN